MSLFKRKRDDERDDHHKKDDGDGDNRPGKYLRKVQQVISSIAPRSTSETNIHKHQSASISHSNRAVPTQPAASQRLSLPPLPSSLPASNKAFEEPLPLLPDSVPNPEKAFQLDTVIGCCRSVSTFEQLEELGQGTYGVVYRARDMESGEIVALKKVRMEREKDGLPITVLREIKVLKALSHPNIVKMLEIAVGQKKESIFLVFEYIEHDLACLLDNMKNPFSLAEVKCLFIQLLKAVDYLHKNWIVHRDLKLSNLLLNNQGQLKLADFGLARWFGEPIKPYTPEVVTIWYRAPELLFASRQYTTAVDIWALGCVLGELIIKKPLLPGTSEIDQIYLIQKLLGSPNPKIWPGFLDLPNAKKITLINQPYNTLTERFPKLSQKGIDLIRILMAYDPERRISADQALKHEFFTEKPYPEAQKAMPTFSTNYHLPSQVSVKDQHKEKPSDLRWRDSLFQL